MSAADQLPQAGVQHNYATWAPAYRDAGWLGALPNYDSLTEPVPAGYTGRKNHGVWPTDEQVIAWSSVPTQNLGLRLPEDVVCIDIDAYDGKKGLDTFEWYELNLGPLPRTWFSTSRGATDPSRKLLFRAVLPPGREWRKGLQTGNGRYDGDVDIIHHGYRFVRCWPSIAPRTGQHELWYGPDSKPATRLPRPEELPRLPDAWLDVATRVIGERDRSRTSSGAEAGLQLHDHERSDESLWAEEHGGWIAGAGSWPGAQRDYLVAYLGFLCGRNYGTEEMITLACQVAIEEFEDTRPEWPWTVEEVTAMVHEVRGSWGVADGVVIPESFVRRMREGKVPKPVQDHANKLLIEDEAKALVLEYRLEQARGPRPKRTIAEAVEQPPVQAVIEDVLAAELNLLGGPSEAGKSLLARDWALAVATGEPWQGKLIPEIRNVLWVASEGTHDMRERWTGQPRWERAAGRVFVLEEPVNLVARSDVDWLLDEYRDERPGLVVFDVIYGMGMSDDNSVKDVLPVIESCKRLSAAWGAATLALGHSGHNGDRRFRGSSSWRQLAAVEWHMRDEVLTCEKSKISNKNAGTFHYQVGYPDLLWHSTDQLLGDRAQRDALIRNDFRLHEGDSQADRARRLHRALDCSVERARTLIRAVEKTMNAGDE